MLIYSVAKAFLGRIGRSGSLLLAGVVVGLSLLAISRYVKPTPKRWIVTTTGTRSLNEIAGELTKRGFVVERVLAEVGCVTGTATEATVSGLRSIPGVADVSLEPAPAGVGPPGAPVTW